MAEPDGPLGHSGGVSAFLHHSDDRLSASDVTFPDLVVDRGYVVPQMSDELLDVFACGLLADQRVTLVLTLATVDLFLVHGLGYLIVRQTPEFDDTDWQLVCAQLPAGTFIDPGEWEQVFAGTEILFIPGG